MELKSKDESEKEKNPIFFIITSINSTHFFHSRNWNFFEQSMAVLWKGENKMENKNDNHNNSCEPMPITCRLEAAKKFG